MTSPSGSRQGSSPAAPPLDILQIITSTSADGITIQDKDGRLVYANDAAAHMAGFSSGAELERASAADISGRFEMLDERGLPLAVDDLPGRRALRGERDAKAVVCFREVGGGDRCWALVHATPLMDEQGEIGHAVNVFVDVSADRDRERVQRFLADATKELVGSLNWEGTLQRVARLAVPDLADWCAVDLLEPDGSLSLVALAHVDPEKLQWALELRERFPLQSQAPYGVANVVRTGVSELTPEVTQELIDAAGITDEGLLEVIEQLHLSSVMYVPLVARGRTLGALEMVWAESGRHYTNEDVHVAEELAARAALAIDNARLYTERDRMARSLQERLLPKRLPPIADLLVAARYFAAEDGADAGGDFYDLFEMDDGSWKAVVGDVCGKGSEAAALMGFVRFTTRAVSRQDTNPSEALVKVNRALLEELEGDAGSFCTVAVARIRTHIDRAELTVAVAGHPLPMILRGTGALETAGTVGTLLGVFEEIDVTNVRAELGAGDTLIMWTDGVLEASKDASWLAERIPQLLSSSAGLSPEAIALRIESAVADLQDRHSDDIAMLILQVPATDDPPSLEHTWREARVLLLDSAGRLDEASNALLTDLGLTHTKLRSLAFDDLAISDDARVILEGSSGALLLRTRDGKQLGYSAQIRTVASGGSRIVELLPR